MAVTTQQARDRSGVPSTKVSDVIAARLLSEAKTAIENEIDVVNAVVEEVESLNGDPYNEHRFPRTSAHHPLVRKGWVSVRVKHRPLLSVREISINGTTVDPKNVKWDRAGRIWLAENATRSLWDSQDYNENSVRYLHGNKEAGTTRTKINEANGVTGGSSITFSVDDASSFSANDYIEISSMNGNKEVTQITSISSNDVTVDELVYDHTNNAVVSLMTEEKKYDVLVAVEAGIRIILYNAGLQEDSRQSYSLGDQSVTKVKTGHAKQLEALINERDRILDKFTTFEAH